jgi:hypothetical protein
MKSLWSRFPTLTNSASPRPRQAYGSRAVVLRLCVAAYRHAFRCPERARRGRVLRQSQSNCCLRARARGTVGWHTQGDFQESR